jgi:hypothetical protein
VESAVVLVATNEMQRITEEENAILREDSKMAWEDNERLKEENRKLVERVSQLERELLQKENSLFDCRRKLEQSNSTHARAVVEHSATKQNKKKGAPPMPKEVVSQHPPVQKDNPHVLALSKEVNYLKKTVQELEDKFAMCSMNLRKEKNNHLKTKKSLEKVRAVKVAKTDEDAVRMLFDYLNKQSKDSD